MCEIWVSRLWKMNMKADHEKMQRMHEMNLKDTKSSCKGVKDQCAETVQWITEVYIGYDARDECKMAIMWCQGWMWSQQLKINIKGENDECKGCWR